MRVNTVSIHPVQKGTPSHTEKNVSFKHVNYMELTRPEIQKLYEDGPGIIRMIDKVVPVLEEKFGKFFDSMFYVYGDYFRYIQVKLTGHTADRIPKLKNYIVENNDKIFQFPEFLINDFKSGKRNFDVNYDEFLYGYPRIHALDFEFAKLGEQKSTEKLLKFAEENDINSIIKKAYLENPPEEFKKKSTVASSYVYGNPAV